MIDRVRHLLIASLATLAPAAPAAAQPVGADRPDYASGAPGVLSEVKFVQKPGSQVPLGLAFRDERGEPVRLGDLLGDRPVVLNLVYFECPLLCNQVLDGLVRSLNVLDDFTVGEEFDVLSISISPSEGPELARAKQATVMRAYHHADEAAERGWHFLTTGDKATIDAVADAAGFSYHYNEETELYAHAAGIMILTPEGRVARYIYGISYPARDLRLSLTEASRGEVGGVLEQALLLCYAYDPESGTYSFAIMNVVRLLGTATLIGLASYMAIMFFRDRRRAAGSAARADAPPPQPSH